MHGWILLKPPPPIAGAAWTRPRRGREQYPPYLLSNIRYPGIHRCGYAGMRVCVYAGMRICGTGTRRVRDQPSRRGRQAGRQIGREAPRGFTRLKEVEKHQIVKSKLTSYAWQRGSRGSEAAEKEGRCGVYKRHTHTSTPCRLLSFLPL
jgi:hypothetical protein